MCVCEDELIEKMISVQTVFMQKVGAGRGSRKNYQYKIYVSYYSGKDKQQKDTNKQTGNNADF
jgi:hypothetical protein